MSVENENEAPVMTVAEAVAKAFAEVPPEPAPEPAEASPAADVAPATEPAPLTFAAALAHVTGEEPAAGPVQPMPAAPPPGSAAGERQRAATLVDIAAQAQRLGVAVDVNACIQGEVEPELLRRRVLEVAAARARASAINTAPPAESAFRAGPSAQRQSPIVAMAEAERARFEKNRG